ncbi:hypothetical protein [Deinococcus multiflagellatus]|uniref:Zinc ribbon domain-containing protein n=1 Tax=Deinococcus multiflagellatus TaxID=1656887 RepID=A0ABW1ZGD0_9DEIO|nr:hypothetical protein [Deinococcus multiflagellatus]MBZ9712225.1 hypothetical protein [Deinococcus multiflagellatus]
MTSHAERNLQQIEWLRADLRENGALRRSLTGAMAELGPDHPDYQHYREAVRAQQQARIEQIEQRAGYRPTVWCLNPGCHMPYAAELPACPECGTATRPAPTVATTPCQCGQPRPENAALCRDCEDHL